MNAKEALILLKSQLTNCECIRYGEYITIIEYALNRLEELERVLKIIKEKKVNVGDFIRCETIDDYNDYCCYGDDEHLTETEFNLLKEYLK